jgi:hypothetical protein
MFRKWYFGVWTSLGWLRIGKIEFSNEPSGFIKWEEFLD